MTADESHMCSLPGNHVIDATSDAYMWKDSSAAQKRNAIKNRTQVY